MKELYKVDVIKLIIIVAVITTIVVLGVVFAVNFISKKNPQVINETGEKISERLGQGVVEKKEKIKPEEAVLKAINVNRSRVVKIYQSDLEKASTPDNKNKMFLARGIIISKDGLIATAKGAFRADDEYAIVVPGRQDVFKLKPVKVGEKLAFFKIPTKFDLVVALEKSQPKKGDLVVAIGGREKDGMAVGEILNVEKVLKNTFITTTIPPKSIEAGTPLINQDKKIIGVYTAVDEQGKSLFVSGRDIKKDISNLN